MEEEVIYDPVRDGFFNVFKDVGVTKKQDNIFHMPLGDDIELPEGWYVEDGIPVKGTEEKEETKTGSVMINDNNPEVKSNLQKPQEQQKVHTTKSKPTKSEREYVEQYADYAMDQMKKYGIPASITLAQGLIETNHGTSRLSRVANNHFGIKGTYNGNFVLANDDKPNEKFRKYDDPLQSFEDHSKLLRGSRYQVNVGNLALDDYKGWAKGIKKSGYATAPNYAQSLIDVIERNGLQKYDKLVLEQKNV